MIKTLRRRRGQRQYDEDGEMKEMTIKTMKLNMNGDIDRDE